MLKSERLIGQEVLHIKSKRRGRITQIDGNSIYVDYYDHVVKYGYPAAFADILRLRDIELQESLQNESMSGRFEQEKMLYMTAINNEVHYLKASGGKRYRVIDGELIFSGGNDYIYSFETDAELHFPDGTAVKIWQSNRFLSAEIISCEEFVITLKTSEYMGKTIESIEFSADQWFLLSALSDRIQALNETESPLAYEILCTGRTRINSRKPIETGQHRAIAKATSEPITFIWGPPGTGKTSTLAKIAAEYIAKGKRVLMLSYSNVSVDGALLRVANVCDNMPGEVIRYGYPRLKELIESKTLTSYAYVLNQNKEESALYRHLLQQKHKLSAKDPKRMAVNRQISQMKSNLTAREIDLVRTAHFVATTVSKAVVDSAIYTQKFDLVIFDEASMAYVPQIVFAASLAKSAFCCLGDFKQLSAIVQNPENKIFKKDIFEHTGITSAINSDISHDWLVMLNQQYRMHPDIADFAGKIMYHGLLQSPSEIYVHKQKIADCFPFAEEAMGLVDLSDTYSVCIKTGDGSHINLMSAMLGIRIAEYFAEKYEVGIITPYSAQSRLILSIIRDLQERDEKYKSITCATVHQFQGSEKAVIIYDAVDCFHMPYPGILLTGKENDQANRLFNVALTRAQGKFILIVNQNFMTMKHLAKDLMFSEFMKQATNYQNVISGENLFEKLGTPEKQKCDMFFGDRDEEDCWNRFLHDIEQAKKSIFMEIPGEIDDDYDALQDLGQYLKNAAERGVKILVRTEKETVLLDILRPYRKEDSYITTPIVIVDGNIVWFGQPLSAACFRPSGKVLETEYFPCLRFKGKHVARQLKAIFNIPNMQEKKHEHQTESTG